MKADFTRDTFDPLKHFTRVLMQQGRVQVDADWNEQTSILLRYLQALAADLIGEAGGPVNNCGFGLVEDPALSNDFRLTPGRYYVNGILCEIETATIPVARPAQFAANEIQVPTYLLDATPFTPPNADRPRPYVEIASNTGKVIVQITDFDHETRKLTLSDSVQAVMAGATPRLRRVVTYLTQPDYVPPGDAELVPNAAYLAYLDVWERHVTHVEDDSIREVALNGVDTATRAQLVWQVKLAKGTPPARGQGLGGPCDGFTLDDKTPFAHPALADHGRLKAKAKQDAQATDPCITPPHVQYRGVENQLYRVEIHQGGVAWSGDGELPAEGAATFKWSRENGSVIYSVRSVTVTSSSKTTVVTLETLGRDDRFGLVEGDWVELTNDDHALHGIPSPLLQVQAIDRARSTVTLSGLASATFAEDAARHPLLRRWDQKQGDPSEGGLRLASDGAALIVESGSDLWLELEDGVKVQFQPSGAANSPFSYRTGDYWLIPARVATGDVEWPTVTDPVSGAKGPVAEPPKGVFHHYAPLGVVTVDADGSLAIASCRKQFAPLAKRPPYDYAFDAVGIGTRNLVLPTPAPKRARKPPK